jgi:hypothetical protein
MTPAVSTLGFLSSAWISAKNPSTSSAWISAAQLCCASSPTMVLAARRSSAMAGCCAAAELEEGRLIARVRGGTFTRRVGTRQRPSSGLKTGEKIH